MLVSQGESQFLSALQSDNRRRIEVHSHGARDSGEVSKSQRRFKREQNKCLAAKEAKMDRDTGGNEKKLCKEAKNKIVGQERKHK